MSTDTLPIHEAYRQNGVIGIIVKIFSDRALRKILFKDGRLSAILLFSGVMCLLNVLSPMALGNFITAVQTRSGLHHALAVMCAISLAVFVAEMLCSWLGITGSCSFALALRRSVIGMLGAWNPGAVSGFSKGSIGMKMLRDTANITMISRDIAIIAVNAVFGSILSIIIAFRFSPYLGGVFLLAVAVEILILSPFFGHIKTRNHDYRLSMDQTMETAFCTMSELDYLRSLDTAGYADRKLKTEFEELYSRQRRMELMNFSFTGVLQFLLAAGELTVLVVCGLMAWRGRLAIGNVVTFQLLFVKMFGSINGVFRIIPYLGMIGESVDSLHELQECDGTEYDAEKIIMKDFTGHVRLKNVTFSYPGSDRPVLKEFNAEFVPGTCTALVGENGIGKTTLLKLITAYTPPDSGSVEFDGIPEDKLNRDSLRQKISILSQDNLILNGTLRENITLGLNYPDAEIAEIISRCGLNKLMRKLTHGLDTELHDRPLSGGERQRLAIARALIRKPALAVFDEISNHLDDDGIDMMAEAITELKKRTTVVLVAHGHYKELADKIIKLA